MFVANKVLLEKLEIEGRKISYFREDGLSGYKQCVLPHGVALIDLQKLNIDSIACVKTFIEKYGFIQIGISGLLFRLFRYCSESNIYPFLDIDAVEDDCKKFLETFEGCLGCSHDVEDIVIIDVFSESERVRRTLSLNKNFKYTGGVMSVTEAQYTLRLMQNAIAIIVANDCFRDNSQKFFDYLFKRNKAQSKILSFEPYTQLFLRDHRCPNMPVRTTKEIENDIARWTDSAAEAKYRMSIYNRWRTIEQKIACSESLIFIETIKNSMNLNNFNEKSKKILKFVFNNEGFSQCLDDDSPTLELLEQLNKTLLLSVHWRFCQNPHCGKLFKYHKELNPKSAKKLKLSKYCSNSCRSMAKQIVRKSKKGE